MIQNLEILKPGQFVEPQKGLYFELNGFHFSFDAEEARKFKFLAFEDHYKVEYHAARFSLSRSDAIALQEKIKELAN
ncbi:hypothetical protein [Acinetobacter pittii]